MHYSQEYRILKLIVKNNPIAIDDFSITVIMEPNSILTVLLNNIINLISPKYIVMYKYNVFTVQTCMYG